MIPFLNRNDEKWPHTRQIKIAGRNHILPPLGIKNINYAKLINPKQREFAASHLFRKLLITNESVQWFIGPCLMDVLIVSQRRTTIDELSSF